MNHGDLSGDFNMPTVVGLRGIQIDTTAPSNGQALTYNSTAGKWKPQTISAGGGGTSSPLTPTATKTADYTAAINELVLAYPQAATFVVTFPTAPADKSVIAVKNIATNGNAVTVALGGSDTFQMTGTGTTSIYIPGQTTTYQYNASTQKWIALSNEFPTYSDTADVTLQLKTTGTGKAATINLDSASSTQGNLQGRVNGSIIWMLGSAGDSGFNIYTPFTKALSIDSSQVSTFNGNISMNSGKNFVFATSTGTKIGTGITQKMAFWNSTPIAQPSGSLLTAIANLGLVSSPTIAESDVTNLTADLAAKLANITGLVTAGTNVTVTGSGTSGSPYVINSTASGSGTVTTVSVVSANGLAGSVTNPTTTPAITLSTSVTGLLKGNGTAISAAISGTDYVVPSGSITGNAATATALQTARTINGVSFDGTANITVQDRLTQTATQTADYSANANELVIMQASTAALNVTLPTAPADKTIVAIKKIDSTSNYININTGGSDVFLTSGASTTSIMLAGETHTYRYDSSSGKWVGHASYIPLYQTNADSTLILKTVGSGKAVTINMDSNSSTQGNIQGRVNGTLAWMIGRAGNSGLNFYTNGATQAVNISDTLVTTFNGDVTISGSKNIVLSSSTGTKLATSTAQKLGFWNATPVAQQSGNVMTALSTIGLVASPVLAESDITNLTTDLAAKAPLASPALTGTPTAPTATLGTNTTQLATTAFVLANAGGTPSPLTTKGDVWVYSTTNARLPIGTDGQVLVADSTQTAGMKWATTTGTGDMLAATYDPAGVATQVVGLTSTQTLTNKTLTAPTINGTVASTGLTLPGFTTNGSISANPTTTRTINDFQIKLTASSTSRAPLLFQAAGSAPTSPADGNMWYDSTGLGFRQSSTTRYLVLDTAAQALTNKNVSFTASTTSAASMNIASGTAPTSPADGDIWYDGTNLKMRVGGTTKTFTLT